MHRSATPNIATHCWAERSIAVGSRCHRSLAERGATAPRKVLPLIAEPCIAVVDRATPCKSTNSTALQVITKHRDAALVIALLQSSTHRT